MSLLFNGDFANPDEPLWLRAFYPAPPPQNLQVSTITVNPTGGILMAADTTAPPNTTTSAISFDRTGNDFLNAVQLQTVPSKGVPGRGDNINFLAVTTTAGLNYDELALGALQIYGDQPTFPVANQGAAGRLTQGANPFSVELKTGVFYTSLISTNTLNAGSGNFSTFNANSAQFSTISISSGQGVIPNNLVVSTIQAQSGAISTFNALTVASPIVNAQTVNTSTLNVSTFAIPNALTISSINASTINVGTISSLVGNFSTINAPGGTNTPIVSSIITVAKEILTSTMSFTTTLSPKLDLGLGGIIGGLAGGFGANAMGVGLGAAGLATGATALILSRLDGGLNPGQFQTVNGTTQLQFSTLGVGPGTSKFLTTDSADPLHAPGNIITQTTNQNFFRNWAMRSVSDPLNLPNASGAAGQGIQSFGEWVNPFPGAWAMRPSTILNTFNNNYMSFGEIAAPAAPVPTITFGNILQPQMLVEVKGQLGVEFGLSAENMVTDAIQAPSAVISTITAFQPPNTFLSTVGIYPGITTSTINVSSINVGTTATFNFAVANNLTVGNNVNVTNNVTTSNINLQQINGQPYSQAGQPPGSLMMWPAGNALTGPTNIPPGYLYCDGEEFSVGAPFVALYAAIGNTWGGTPGVTFKVPDTRGRAPFGSVVDATAGTSYSYTAEVTFNSTNVSGPGVLGGTTNNGWFVTATTSQVYIGMTFNFSGTVGVRKIIKILGTTGIGNGWVTPFVIVWDAPTATVFPSFIDSVSVINAESDTTIAPFIGRSPSQPGSGVNLQSQLGAPGITQATDQVGPHIHSFFRGGREAGGGAEFTAGFPNVAQDTSQPKDQYSFIVPGTGANVSGTNTMNNLPPNFAVFYFIKV